MKTNIWTGYNFILETKLQFGRSILLGLIGDCRLGGCTSNVTAILGIELCSSTGITIWQVYWIGKSLLNESILQKNFEVFDLWFYTQWLQQAKMLLFLPINLHLSVNKRSVLISWGYFISRTGNKNVDNVTGCPYKDKNRSLTTL